MSIDLFFALAAFALVSSITPGPNNIMLLTSGANFGFYRTVPHMLGVNLGFTFMVLVVGLGLSQVFTAYPLIYTVLKYLCASYLVYLAYKVATSHADFERQGANSKPLTFLQAASFQWINPKAWTMALSAISLYALDNSWLAVSWVALVFGLLNLPAILCWVVLGKNIRRFLSDETTLKYFNGVMAVLLLGTLVPVFLPDV